MPQWHKLIRLVREEVDAAVDAEEIGRLIGELENRVERLRSLYEQYFMGIERIEPLTLRKDIDRRLWALRREQIRNTGLRFKLETTIQRYNTYQQYWQRIVREIEAGTYQRDLGRAAQRFGDNVVTAFARRRQKLYEKGVEKKAEREAFRRTGAAETSQAPPADEAIEEAPPSSNESLDVTFEDADAAVSRAAASPPLPVPEPHEPLELEISEPAPPPPPRSPPTAPRPFGAPASDPRRATGPMAPGTAAANSPAAPQRPGPPAGSPVAPNAINPGPARPAQASAAAPPAYAAPPAGGLGKPAPPPPRAPFASSAGGATKPVAPVGTQAKPVAPAAPAARPAPSPVASAPKPAQPIAPIAAKPAQPTVPMAAKPASPAAQRPAVPAARPPAASRPDVPPPGAVLSDDNGLSPIRMRQIYGQFVEAKRKANESTAAVTYEKIASNLESVAKELRAKHNARSVDFEVVMKNGKPVLKPVVKG